MQHGNSRALTVATYNIHKGFSHFNRRMVVHDMRERLRMMGADIMFLQEVVGHNARHVENHESWPEAPQHEFFAEANWPASAYAKNSIYVDGHHGNAILSRYPMIRCDHEDISTNRIEKRGLLHAELKCQDGPKTCTACACTWVCSGARDVNRLTSCVPALRRWCRRVRRWC